MRNVSCVKYRIHKGIHKSRERDYMKKLLLYYCSVAFLFLAVGLANADIITHTGTWSTTPGIIGVTPFDPSVGTLDKVSVSVDGQLQMHYFSPDNFTVSFYNPFDFYITALPQLTVDGESYIEKYIVHGSSPTGFGGQAYVTLDFAYDFVFNHTTDLIGRAPVSSSSSISYAGTSGSYIMSYEDIRLNTEIVGKLSDYYSIANASFNSSFIPVTVGLSGYETTFTTASPGSITISYDYTPSPAPVPEPTTMFLLGLGLVGLVRGRRKFQN